MDRNMDDDEAIAALDALTGGDPERDHSTADGILLAVASSAVVAAYREAAERVGFWYA